MDSNNWRPNQGTEPSIDTSDWRAPLMPESRQRVVNKIMDTLKKHLPVSGPEGLLELRKIAQRFEEKIFTAATSQSDYLRKISLKMLTMETKSQNTMANKMPSNQVGPSNKPPDQDEATTQRTLDITRNTSFQMVNLVNAFVINVANANVPPFIQDIYYNQFEPFMPLLCNPFFPNLTERTCDPFEVDLKSAPTAYQSFLCNTSPSGLCITMGRLTPSLYNQMIMAINMSDTLHQHGPFLASMVDCSFVVETFAHFSTESCLLLRRYSTQVFVGLVLISIAVLFSVILWVVFVRERRFQISSKKLTRTHVEVQSEKDH